MAGEPDGGRASAATRRRGTVLEQAILDAAAEELKESGYSGLTMDRVARRAGTNKNAIYRRWPSRAALAVAAYGRMTVTEARVPDTGELRGDALELLRAANRHLSSPLGRILLDLLASARDDPDLLAEIQARTGGDGLTGMWLTVLGRAVARGEAAPEALHPRVATVPIALLRNELLTRGVTGVPDEVLVEIIDEVYLPLVRGRGPR
ncbi:TetR family transcriptional regulator [Thermopolyspora flexuosa]|uniref:TetR family transcriptional regulator n=1 Tax=Thermopolyspora flexuosa TaxID=103836 RepID=A0A543IQ51_9ACTN|nr:TetR/AcrR family transcriptional regulator [Thermopolyspora flexuosa]TQM72706.1 TetR family transcriptional regulator [Thermopolyspora flexuosa]GGM68526.1 TetR family transcriptional regulator [Thermopolyspora flexuosa]